MKETGNGRRKGIGIVNESVRENRTKIEGTGEAEKSEKEKEIGRKEAVDTSGYFISKV